MQYIKQIKQCTKIRWYVLYTKYEWFLKMWTSVYKFHDKNNKICNYFVFFFIICNKLIDIKQCVQ